MKGSAAGLADDAFLVATAGSHLYGVSGGHKGAIYGVVHLLEKYFGCRVFSPTVRVLPARDTLSLPEVSDRESPANQFRAVNGEFSRDADYRDWQRLDVVEDVFGRGYYGAAAPWMAKDIEGLDAAISRSGARLDIYEPPVAHAETYLSFQDVTAFNELFARAEAAVGGDARHALGPAQLDPASPARHVRRVC